MRLKAPQSDDRDWLAMRLRLWPEATASEHARDMVDALARGHFVRVAVDSNGAAAGFVEASKRVDYVNGTSSSRVAFLEGLYVEPPARRTGVARALVEAVVAWASAQGCRELASDSPIANIPAHAVHRALGFAETERVVYFLRTLPDL
jgi:aminoglycoside 6'-N-acetyltransferase I